MSLQCRKIYLTLYAVNSYNACMTSWTPVLMADDRPLYRQLGEAIGKAIEGGELDVGAQLPTQRALAQRLGIALTTVTRGYAEAERSGWIRSDVGRGTFVRGASVEGEAGGELAVADLRPNILAPTPFEQELRESAARRTRDSNVALFDYAQHAGRLRHREAGARLFAAVGVESSAEHVLVTVGAQHAMMIAFASLLAPGETLLVEARTYGGVRSIAQLLGLRLEPVALDEHGLLPDALAAAARRSGARVVYAMSVLQNPTGAVMGAERIEAIARVVAELGLTVVEDDSYGFLLPESPRLAARIPGSLFLTGTSKSLFPTLRIGFLHAPLTLMPRLEAAIAATVYVASPLVGELVAEWLASGLFERIVAWKRDETRARQAMASAALADASYTTHPASPHGWLELPRGWTSAQFIASAAERGLLLPPGENFAIGATPPAVRLVVGPVATRPALARALTVIVELLRRGAERGEVIA